MSRPVRTSVDRRAVLGGSVALASAITTSTVPAVAGLDPDAELLMLREPWQRALRAELHVIELRADLDRRCFAQSPPVTSSTFNSYLDEASRREHARMVAERNAIRIREDEPEVERRHQEVSATRDTIIDQIVTLPARTPRGLAFKAEVSADWEHDHANLVQSIMDDVVAMAGATP